MPNQPLLYRILGSLLLQFTMSRESRLLVPAFQCQYATTVSTGASLKDENRSNTKEGKWFTLPPYSSTINGSALGRALCASGGSNGGADKAVSSAETTALKWVLRCCPDLPRSLVQKLFRLRQVRREASDFGSDHQGVLGRRLTRVAAKDSMNPGDQIFLPITVKLLPSDERKLPLTKEEVNFIHSLVLHRDSAIIVLNKPPGMPVQGGIGIKTSLDELASTCLSYGYSEPPRLVHRLDRDSSGILVMGRTQDIDDKKRILQKRYLALVLGSPRRQRGLISAPLGKVVVDNGKSDRITVVDNAQDMSCQHAITQYQVIRSSSHGLTWLELCPLTGRKHQLRVHCAQVLGTPIVGDYKYGWQAHRKWEPLPWSDLRRNSSEICPFGNIYPFDLDLNSGSISDKQRRLHLHCKQMVFPDISQALQDVQLSPDCDFAQLESLEFNARLPSYMQRSWDIMNS
ncbi:RNA pseudouridine synthase 4, mitochondrial isoform X2 [Tripterygium wilfordii]|uniref:RNA pseudouridine synthase 4, mitochondrial isoform X2 n=1 Tax=Tripterygium wilfordii TaxID=458696 RepID=UPI0018F7F705|nr:RNA pseudouridine synthase 4, mitochondrial isoform X2 [Tripterygium wilfordii]